MHWEQCRTNQLRRRAAWRAKPTSYQTPYPRGFVLSAPCAPPVVVILVVVAGSSRCQIGASSGTVAIWRTKQKKSRRPWAAGSGNKMKSVGLERPMADHPYTAVTEMHRPANPMPAAKTAPLPPPALHLHDGAAKLSCVADGRSTNRGRGRGRRSPDHSNPGSDQRGKQGRLHNSLLFVAPLDCGPHPNSENPTRGR